MVVHHGFSQCGERGTSGMLSGGWRAWPMRACSASVVAEGFLERQDKVNDRPVCGAVISGVINMGRWKGRGFIVAEASRDLGWEDNSMRCDVDAVGRRGRPGHASCASGQDGGRTGVFSLLQAGSAVGDGKQGKPRNTQRQGPRVTDPGRPRPRQAACCGYPRRGNEQYPQWRESAGPLLGIADAPGPWQAAGKDRRPRALAQGNENRSLGIRAETRKVAVYYCQA
jgi:hypothetical protein